MADPISPHKIAGLAALLTSLVIMYGIMSSPSTVVNAPSQRAPTAKVVRPPTAWNAAFSSSACRRQLEVDAAYMSAARRTSGFYCKGRPLLYSPSQKLAYLKTPKAASIALQELFQRQFADAKWVTTTQTLPDDVFTFTFVREPVSRVVSAFAEIDITYARRASTEKRRQMNTTFHKMSRSTDLGVRFLAFLDDLVAHRFGGDDRDHWAPTHGYPQANFVCRHKVHYVGHLENQDADWKAVQTMAHVPAHKHTTIPVIHEASKEDCQVGRPCHEKLVDKNVTMTPVVQQRICDLYRSDFVCFGYAMPRACTSSALASPTAAAFASVMEAARMHPAVPAVAPAAPLYFIPHNEQAAHGVGRFRVMVQQPAFKNTLFIYVDSVENRTSHTPPQSKDKTGLGGNGDASVRPLNRYGWLRKLRFPAQQPAQQSAGEGLGKGLLKDTSAGTADAGPAQMTAPLSVGIPLLSQGRGFSSLTPTAKSHIDSAVAEAAQLLLLHAYDAVCLSAEVFGAKGAALARIGVSADVAAYAKAAVMRLADPMRIASQVQEGRGGGGGGGDAAAAAAAAARGNGAGGDAAAAKTGKGDVFGGRAGHRVNSSRHETRAKQNALAATLPKSEAKSPLK